jgi:2'-hydroxyisoflavone reductase
MSTRRELLKLSVLGAAAAATTHATAAKAAAKPMPAKSTSSPAPKPLHLLILGGTGYTGPNQVRYALERGHKVTVFNRGRKPQTWPGEVEELIGDRDTGDVAALKGRTFDACIDNPTSVPFWVRDVGAVLKGNVKHYIFISTLSVYAKDDIANADETAATHKYKGKDVYAETMVSLRANMALYGPLKAACEREALKHFGANVSIIRPGFIVGPDDPYDRLTYWVQRMARAGSDRAQAMLLPGDGKDPLQYIDPRDLAEWTIRMAERAEFGTFNATGPQFELSSEAFFYGLRAATTSGVTFEWLDTKFIDKNALSPGGDLPVWVPRGGETAGFATRNTAKARAAGLTFRAVATTALDTLAYFNALPAERRNGPLRSGLTPEREAALQKAWREKKG